MPAHKPWTGVAILVTVVLTQSPATVWAQADGDRQAAQVVQFLSVGGSALVYAFPSLFHINEGPPSCAPCDLNGLPWFDRWAVRPVDHTVSHVSTGVGLALAVGTWVDLAHVGGGKAVAASIEAAGWAAATTALAKTIIGRERPVMYTNSAVQEADHINNQRSMPSGHTSTAFAMATMYVLYTKDRDNKLPALLAGTAAVTVGVLRIVSAKHFPSDVVVGALLGTASGVALYEIRF